MKYKVLKNPTYQSIINYPIGVAELDTEENAVIDQSTGWPKWTGETQEWTIHAGEVLEFPEYVADYLLHVYGFLEVVDPSTIRENVTEASVEPPVEGEHIEEKLVSTPKAVRSRFYCKECDKEFKSMASYGMHLGGKHPEKLNV